MLMSDLHSRTFPPVVSIIRTVRMFPGRFDRAMKKPSIYTVREGSDTGGLNGQPEESVIYWFIQYPANVRHQL